MYTKFTHKCKVVTDNQPLMSNKHNKKCKLYRVYLRCFAR